MNKIFGEPKNEFWYRINKQTTIRKNRPEDDFLQISDSYKTPEIKNRFEGLISSLHQKNDSKNVLIGTECHKSVTDKSSIIDKKNIGGNPVIRYHSHFLNMMKKGLICFSCGSILRSSFGSKIDSEISSIQTCPSNSDAAGFTCAVEICGRSVCNPCLQFSRAHDVFLFNPELSTCIICEYQSAYNQRNPINPRAPIEWHWAFHTPEDLTFLRKVRSGLINGNGLHIELSGKRQGCWRRRKDGKRKHFSFKQHGGFFESRAVALEFKAVHIKTGGQDCQSAPLMITALGESYLAIVPRRIHRGNQELHSHQRFILSSINDGSCAICFQKQANIHQNASANTTTESRFVSCVACGRFFCRLCILYIRSRNPCSQIAAHFISEKLICALCQHLSAQSTDKFAQFIHDFCYLLPSNTPLIKFDKYNMKWKTPYGSVSVVESGGILESRREAYFQLETGQSLEVTCSYDRNIFYGEIGNKLGYYTQFAKNGMLRVYGPFETYDEAGRRWDLDALKYYGAEKAMRKAFFPKLLTWLSLPQTLQRYFLAPWIVWSMDKDDNCQKSQKKVGITNNAISKTYDVIIIGAGVSGLKSAEALINKGFSVIVLEAQNIPFGRISSYSQWTNHKRRLSSEICFYRERRESRESSREAERKKTNDENTEELVNQLSEETVSIANELIRLSLELLEEVVIDIFHPLSAVLKPPIKEFMCKGGNEYFEKVNPAKLVLQRIKEFGETVNWRWILINYCLPLSLKRLNIKNLPSSSKKYIEKATCGDYGENLFKNIEQFYWERLPRFVGFEELPWREYWCYPKNNLEKLKPPANILHHIQLQKESIIERSFDECDLIDCELQKLIQNNEILNNTHFNSPVSDILYNNETDQVNVRISNGTWFSSSCVICTLPIGVLKKSVQSSENTGNSGKLNGTQGQFSKISIPKNSIKFIPSLPYETIRSIKLLDMSSYTELFLKLNITPILSNLGSTPSTNSNAVSSSPSSITTSNSFKCEKEFDMYFSRLADKIHHLDHPCITMYTHKNVPNTIMCGISAPLAEKICPQIESESNSTPNPEFLSSQQLANICFGILKEIAPKDLEIELLDFSIKSWKDDPYYLGSIPIHSSSSKESNINQLIKPHFEGHLYFAGDGTTVDGFGSIQGALLSAKRVTTQVTQFLSN
ncbi:amine oxidase [Cryptosporidium sp. chipmunk genotype I]|uniref:amine oxidase n=1 Tax=Cryptosporidium sp. chipmunk genotype I TaxID=1280935 RepID=UPI00351AA634|nr:amine oxidase [Cryptosporidium sp. chipmunk genotype I]